MGLFLDLDKTFDMVRHELLFEILEIYGIPKGMMLYENVTLKFISGSIKDMITYSVGVKYCMLEKGY
jgi:hypothetical protein